MSYKYITDNNLYCKQNYMYSEYRGESFIKEYIDSRQGYLAAHKTGTVSQGRTMVDVTANPVRKNLMEMITEVSEGHFDAKIRDSVNKFTKSFEVRKRIYSGYDDSMKPLESSGFEDYASYLLFADLLILVYNKTKCLKYFSCLLKVDDTLLSVEDKLEDRFQHYLTAVIERELYDFNEIKQEQGVCKNAI